MKELKCRICGVTNPEDFYGNTKSLCKVHVLKLAKEKYKDCDYKAMLKNWYSGNILKVRLSAAKNRAIKKNLEFSITLEYLIKVLEDQQNRCVYTGLEFDNSNENLSISVDRIDSSKGYIEGNIQLVLSTINYMKSNMTSEEFIYFCELVYKNSIT